MRGLLPRGLQRRRRRHQPAAELPVRVLPDDAIEFIQQARARVRRHRTPRRRARARRWLQYVNDNRTTPGLIASTREALTERVGPWVIENVDGAPLLDPIRSCAVRCSGCGVSATDCSSPQSAPPPPHRPHQASRPSDGLASRQVLRRLTTPLRTAKAPEGINPEWRCHGHRLDGPQRTARGDPTCVYNVHRQVTCSSLYRDHANQESPVCPSPLSCPVTSVATVVGLHDIPEPEEMPVLTAEPVLAWAVRTRKMKALDHAAQHLVSLHPITPAFDGIPMPFEACPHTLGWIVVHGMLTMATSCTTRFRCWSGPRWPTSASNAEERGWSYVADDGLADTSPEALLHGRRKVGGRHHGSGRVHGRHHCEVGEAARAGGRRRLGHRAVHHVRGALAPRRPLRYKRRCGQQVRPTASQPGSPTSSPIPHQAQVAEVPGHPDAATDSGVPSVISLTVAGISTQ